MKKSKFTEEQMVRILKEVEAGAKVGETCRKHGISEPTYYVWKSKYAGMEVSQLRHLKDLEAELARMKRMYAELALDHHALKDALAKRLSQARRLEWSLAMQTAPGLSARRADRVLKLSRSARYYLPHRHDDGPLIVAMQAHLKDNPGHGFGLLMDWALRPQGWGKTRAWRVYTALKLNLPRRGKRRLPDRIREPLEIPQVANHTWSADFMADALWSGRRFGTFNINDDVNRESMKIEIDTCLPSARVIRALDELVELRGALRRLRLDNDPEFISAALRQWAQQHRVTLIHIQPGKPTQNAYIERFNLTFRTEVLDRFVFTTLDQVRRMAEDWRHRYNHQRPHRSLSGLSPIHFAMA